MPTMTMEELDRRLDELLWGFQDGFSDEEKLERSYLKTKEDYLAQIKQNLKV